ncbi:MAG: AAA family ATPase [Mycetocola sp.]
MSITTRKPTGRPSWPITVLAGREGAGKTWAALSASASPLVGRTLAITIDEDQPDEYGAIPGADFDIVEHDGTARGILATLDEMEKEPDVDGKPTLWVIDSGGRFWDLLSTNAQTKANNRKSNRGEDSPVSIDLWNEAAKDWKKFYDRLRRHNGPVILTSRLEQVVVMNGKNPTTEREWKIQGYKTLPYDAQVIVEMPERGEYLIRKVKSTRFQLKEKTPKPDFTMDWLWGVLGLADGADAREYGATVPDEPVDESGRDWLKELTLAGDDLGALTALGTAATAAHANPATLDVIRAEYKRVKEASTA